MCNLFSLTGRERIQSELNDSEHVWLNVGEAEHKFVKDHNSSFCVGLLDIWIYLGIHAITNQTCTQLFKLLTNICYFASSKALAQIEFCNKGFGFL